MGRFLSVAGPFNGARNDKTAVKFDDFVMDIKDGRKHADATFELCVGDGTSTEQHRGAYVHS